MTRDQLELLRTEARKQTALGDAIQAALDDRLYQSGKIEEAMGEVAMYAEANNKQVALAQRAAEELALLRRIVDPGYLTVDGEKALVEWRTKFGGRLRG